MKTLCINQSINQSINQKVKKKMLSISVQNIRLFVFIEVYVLHCILYSAVGFVLTWSVQSQYTYEELVE
jgi:hypothetical protein